MRGILQKLLKYWTIRQRNDRPSNPAYYIRDWLILYHKGWSEGHKNTNSPSKKYWTHCALASRAKIAKIRQEDSVLTELLKLWWTLILTSSISTRLLMVSVVKTKIIPIIFLSFSIQRSILTTIFASLFIAKVQSCSREGFRIWPLMYWFAD